MAVVWSIAIPAIVVSHVIGLAFLIYGLNRLTNFLTKAWRKLTCVQPAPASPGEGDVENGATGGADTDTDSADCTKHVDLSNASNFGFAEDAEPKSRPPRWTRECKCSVSAIAGGCPGLGFLVTCLCHTNHAQFSSSNSGEGEASKEGRLKMLTSDLVDLDLVLAQPEPRKRAVGSGAQQCLI